VLLLPTLSSNNPQAVSSSGTPDSTVFHFSSREPPVSSITESAGPGLSRETTDHIDHCLERNDNRAWRCNEARLPCAVLACRPIKCGETEHKLELLARSDADFGW
jgi:hypothetical protein